MERLSKSPTKSQQENETKVWRQTHIVKISAVTYCNILYRIQRIYTTFWGLREEMDREGNRAFQFSEQG